MKRYLMWPGLFGIFSILNGCCSYTSKATKKLFDGAKNKSFDMVVVPGAPLTDGKWDRTLKGRIYWSKYLYDNGIAKNIMYSGSSVSSPYNEAEVMAMYAVAIGIPKEHIYTETRAEHSTENIYYSYKKARNLGFKTIALASEPFQTKMLAKYTRKKVSPDVAMIPFVTEILEKMESSMTDPVIDFQHTVVENFIPLKEREGFWKRLRGTRGLNIDMNAYQQ